MLKYIKIVLLAAVFGVSQTPLEAQQSISAVPVLTIDSDRLFRDSEFGQRVLADQTANTAVLNAENRKIEAELSEEEMRLTEDRSDMAAADFRRVADAFDERVVEIRRIQDGKEQAIAQTAESERLRFLQSLAPVFQQLLSETGAQVVLERRATFASVSSIDITDRTIEIANSLLGAGEEDPEISEPVAE